MGPVCPFALHQSNQIGSVGNDALMGKVGEWVSGGPKKNRKRKKKKSGCEREWAHQSH